MVSMLFERPLATGRLLERSRQASKQRSGCVFASALLDPYRSIWLNARLEFRLAVD